ncbi:MAG: hypothetical protein PUD59_05035 [bacterium]|nr:hypothetical protein [bacterium]
MIYFDVEGYQMKVYAKVKIKNYDLEEEYEGKGILNKNKNILIYKDNKKNINIIDMEKNIINRKKNNQEIELNFSDEKKSYCRIVLNSKMENIFEIKLRNIIKNKNNYKIIYSVYNDDLVEFEIELKKA